MEAVAVAPAPLEVDNGSEPAAAGWSGIVPVARIRSIEEIISRCSDEWTELARNASEPNCFLERWFVAASVRHLGNGEPLRIVEVRDDRGLIGLLPVHLSSKYGRLPVRHVENWRHFHSFLGTPLVRAGSERQFWRLAIGALDDASWTSGFFHITALTDGGPVHAGLQAAAKELGRSCDVVLRSERAFLESDLTPQGYYEKTVRKKRRKELKRLASRLGELGTVEFQSLSRNEEIASWCDQFLQLERSGWKGQAGSALDCSPSTASFFREAVAGAFAAGRLDFLRMDLAGKPLAMLVNFIAEPGSFSFKIAFDEEFARFSPGVLIQLENLRVLEREHVRWMDSCASENHPMINSLWAERRALVRVTIPLAGAKRRLVFHVCRTAEDLSGWLRRRMAPAVTSDEPAAEEDGD